MIIGVLYECSNVVQSSGRLRLSQRGNDSSVHILNPFQDFRVNTKRRLDYPRGIGLLTNQEILDCITDCFTMHGLKIWLSKEGCMKTNLCRCLEYYTEKQCGRCTNYWKETLWIFNGDSTSDNEDM